MHTNRPNLGHARRRALLLALALLLAPLLGLSRATPALAAPSCTTSGATVTCTFSYTGAPETWTVPAGVTSATFTVYGAQGSNFSTGAGGKGGATAATLAVTPGQTLQITVGGQATSLIGGFNGGGNGVSCGSASGVGGGGASDVRWDDPSVPGTFTLDERLLVAGGGGGAGFQINGGAGGGINGADGADGIDGQGGRGGSQTAGGAGGSGVLSCGVQDGASGSFGVGGDSGVGAGGGGGGYYGGGGGAYGGGGGAFGGGGGGSGFGPAGATFETGVRSGNGLVIISYSTDTSVPTANPSQSPAANAAGWNNTNVTVHWNWTDNAGGSGIDSANCTTTSSSSGEGQQTLSANCRDLAGNTGNASYSVKVDAIAPTISAAATSSPNANGWYNGDVSVTFSCNDALSGVASCPANQTLTGEGASISSTTQSATDVAGNTSAPSNVVTVQIDRTAPAVSVTGVTNGASYPLGSVPAAGCSTSDALSGVATNASLSVSGSSVGSYTATCSGATDNAGNSGSASVSYQVVYAWSGFFQPVDNLPTINTVKAGQAIPVKFSLGGNYGLNIFAAGYPASQPVACTSGAPLDEIEETVTAGNSSLTYDDATGRYHYVWKTNKAWAGQCRLLTVRLADGTDHTAMFKFR